MEHDSPRLRLWGITPQEERVLDLICRGLTNQEVARRSYLSINTVKTYIRSAYRKIGVGSRTEAVLWGLEHGLGPQPRDGALQPDRPDVLSADPAVTRPCARGEAAGLPSVGAAPAGPPTHAEPVPAPAAEVTAVIGHELGTPLTAIRASAEEALSCLGPGPDLDPLDHAPGPDLATRDETLRRCLDTVLRGTRNLEALRADLARRRRPDADSVEPRLEEVRVRAHLHSTAALTLHRERLTVRCHDQLSCWVQPDHLDRMLTNLVTNAVTYTDGQIDLRAHRDGHHVIIAVEDHGDGVAASFQPHLFDPLVHDRVAGDPTDAEIRGSAGTAGAGLGLYIVRQLARANHGDVRYDQAPHGGARFSVILPATEPTAGHQDRDRERASDHGQGPGAVRGSRRLDSRPEGTGRTA